jgi:hypothetical protein
MALRAHALGIETFAAVLPEGGAVRQPRRF